MAEGVDQFVHDFRQLGLNVDSTVQEIVSALAQGTAQVAANSAEAAQWLGVFATKLTQAGIITTSDIGKAIADGIARFAQNTNVLSTDVDNLLKAIVEGALEIPGAVLDLANWLGSTTTFLIEHGSTTADSISEIISTGLNELIHGVTSLGDDYIFSGSANDIISTGFGSDIIYSAGGNDTIDAGDGNNTIDAGAGQNFITTGSGNDTITSGTGDDTVFAGGGVDTIVSGAGNDIIDAGNDGGTIDAGAGNDTVTVGRYGGMRADGGTGTDRLIVDWSAANVYGASTIMGFSTYDADTGSWSEFNTGMYFGNTDSVSLDGVKTALASSDTVRMDLRVYNGQSYQPIETSLEYKNFEQLDITGSSGNDLFVITQGTKGNYDGRGGAADKLYADFSVSTSDITWDNSDPTVQRTLPDGSTVVNIEGMLIATGSGDDFINNNNTSGSSDYISTGAGNDTIDAGDGNDTIDAGSGDDIVDGGLGSDAMTGGLGNDTYYVNAPGDVVTEAAGQGTDTVISTVEYTLGDNVENLTLAGSADINGTGNILSNVLIGNSGNNVLNGGAGGDTIIGGAGNDTYYVDVIGDVVIEKTDEGTDTVASAITYTLGANVENLTLTGTTAINGTGNELANNLTGNSCNNILNGGLGQDTMIGGLGDDTYYVDAPGDTIIEAAGQGTDIVYSTATYTLTANVENLILSGTAAINGIGNSLANVIKGNSNTNILDGGLGSDTMIGGLGNDTYYVDASGDVAVETAGQGMDTAISTVNYTLGGQC